MGRRGPQPKPTAQRIAEGDAGRLLGKRKREPKPPPGIPAPPTWLGAQARQEWDRLLEILAQTPGLVTLADRDVLACFCEAVADLRSAMATLEAEGDYTTTEKGYVMAHPAKTAKAKAMEQIAKFSARLGLDPASRASLQLPDADGRNQEAEKAAKFAAPILRIAQ